jgi:hypothetical protein
MVLGELYLPLSLREDEGNIGGHKKMEEVLRNCWSKKKSIVIPNMTVLQK